MFIKLHMPGEETKYIYTYFYLDLSNNHSNYIKALH